MGCRSVPQLKLKLAFADEGLEREFRRVHAEVSVPFVRMSWAVALASWLVIHVFFVVAVPERLVAYTILLSCTMYPLIPLLFWLSRGPDRGLLVERLAYVGNTAATIVVVGLGHWLTDLHVMAVGGVTILILFGSVLLRFRALPGAVASGISLAIYQVALAWLWSQGRVSTSEILQSSMVIWLAFSIGLQGGYVLESSSRKLFLQERTIDDQRRALAVEKGRVDRLLHNVLPASIAQRLKDEPGGIADDHPEVTVLFADIVGFTPLSQTLRPAELVTLLNTIFTRFDDLTDEHGLEKIKTIGDAYMAASGLPKARADHARAAVDLGRAMLAAVEDVRAETGEDLSLRIGVYSGHVVAGVIGKRKFAYDLWGDVVNTAARMESHGVPGAVQIGDSTRALLGDAFALEARGTIEIKGKGPMETWLVR